MNEIINTTDIPLEEIRDINGYSFAEYLDPDYDLSVEGAENTVKVEFFTYPGQVVAPGENELMNMADAVLKKDHYENFRDWAEHPFTHVKVMTGTVDDEGIEQWYPQSIASFDVKGKFEFFRCHILNSNDSDALKQFIDKYRNFDTNKLLIPELEFRKFSLLINQQPGGLWGTRNVSRKQLSPFMPRACADHLEDADYDTLYEGDLLNDYHYSSTFFAIRPFDLVEYLKVIESLETKYRAFSVWQFQTEQSFDNHISDIKRILKNMSMGTVIIPYKGNEFYGDEKDTFGVF